MTTTKQSRRLGDRGFEVEWCTKVFVEDDGCTGNPDRDTYKRRVVETRDQALALAKEVYPEDGHGCVVVTPVEWVDPYGDGIPRTFHWDYCGDSLHYSGDAGFEED